MRRRPPVRAFARTGPARRGLWTAATVTAALSLGSVAAGAAPHASAAGKTGTVNAVALCGPVPAGEARCFALRRTDIAAHKGAVPSDAPLGLRPRRPGERLQPAGERRRRTDRRDRRRVRRPERRGRPRGLPRAVRPAAVHHGQRLLPQGRPARRHQLPDPEHRLGRRDLARPRHGLRGRPARAHPAGRGRRQLAATTSARRSTRRSRWARSSSPTATAPATTRRRAAARTRPRSPTSTRTTTTRASRSWPAPATTATASPTRPPRST